MNRKLHHFADKRNINASAEEVFNFADDPLNLSAHMEKPTWKMLWGWMKNTPDEKGGRQVGSVIRMTGSVLGTKLSLEEKVIQREAPRLKVWQTFGDINLLVIGHYTMGFEVTPKKSDSELRVYIDYELPGSVKTRWLGILFGEMYAKWCVGQMTNGVSGYFKND